jgi:RNA polymerase sigma-70 factor (ECF subfamily)
MSEAYDRGRAAWPDVSLDEAAFDAHFAALGADGEHADDVYLACACASGEPAALAAFDLHFLTAVPHFIARIDPSPTLADELKQILREHLLMASAGARPRIAEYSGRGSLGGWLRVIAVRRVHRLRRHRVDDSPSDEAVVAQLVATTPTPEIALLRARYGAQMADAIKSAIAAMPARDRTLLKLHALDGLTIDELCGFYDVHRATVARWIARLRQQLFDEAAGTIRKLLGLDTAEADSLCRALGSQLDVSLGGLRDEA